MVLLGLHLQAVIYRMQRGFRASTAKVVNQMQSGFRASVTSSCQRDGCKEFRALISINSCQLDAKWFQGFSSKQLSIRCMQRFQGFDQHQAAVNWMQSGFRASAANSRQSDAKWFQASAANSCQSDARLQQQTVVIGMQSEFRAKVTSSCQ